MTNRRFEIPPKFNFEDFRRPIAVFTLAVRPDHHIREEGNQLPEWAISRRGHRGSDIHRAGSKAIRDGSSR
jgi:hypothetical protein